MTKVSSTNFGPTLEQRVPDSALRQRLMKQAILQQLRVAVPAIVKAVRVGPPLVVDVQAVIDERVERVFRAASGELAPATKILPLPLLQDVPVVMPSAGGWSLTFPIEVGDECLVIFSDMPIDNWLQSGGDGQVPVSARRHSLSDGIAIFGLRSQPRGLTDYSTDSAQLRNDDSSVVIDLKDNTVSVNAPVINIIGGTVNIGSEVKNRDFLNHTHFITGGATGVVV